MKQIYISALLLLFLLLTLPACDSATRSAEIALWEEDEEINLLLDEQQIEAAAHTTAAHSITRVTTAPATDPPDPDPDSTDPGCPEIPENGPYGQSVTVYVSRNGIYHRISNCSGMRIFTPMTLAEAIENGCRYCQNCWESPAQ